MTALLYLAMYCALAVFVAACLHRARRYARLPVHLRWELYPVPHEPSPRAAHGGSYFEESEWWTKPRHVNRLGEFRVMAREIFLLETVRKSKPSLWWRSQIFHSGVFLVIASVGCQLVAAFIAPIANSLARAGRITGYAGLLLIVGGALLLLRRRVADDDMRDYTHTADIAHLVVLAIAAGLMLVGSLSANTPGAVRFLRAAISFDTTLYVPPMLAAGIFVSAVLLAYIPFSRMAHFIGKYFGYHLVRWDDEPNRGGNLSQALAANLMLKPTWSAGHIGADGKKTWAEIAGENPTEVRR